MYEYVVLTLEFKSPLYGEIDNIKISNALYKLYLLENKKEYIRLINEGFEISTILNSIQIEDKEVITLIPKLFLKKLSQKISEELHREYLTQTNFNLNISHIEKIIKFVRKINKNSQGLIINNKTVYKYYQENKIKELIEKIISAYDEEHTLDNKKKHFSITKNTINRENINVLEENLYTSYLRFMDKVILIIKSPSSYKKEIINKLKTLGKLGLSKKRTIGYGKYKITKKESFTSLKELINKYEIALPSDKNYVHLLGKLITDGFEYANLIYQATSYFETQRLKLVNEDGTLSYTFLAIKEGSSLETSLQRLKNIVQPFYQYNSYHQEYIIPNNPLILEGVDNE